MKTSWAKTHSFSRITHPLTALSPNGRTSEINSVPSQKWWFCWL